MSVKVTSWVWEHAPVAETNLLVLLALADYADEERWVAWPTIETLAKKVRMHTRTVQRHLRQLQEAGVIAIRENQGGRANSDPRRRPNSYQLLGWQSATSKGSGVAAGASWGGTNTPLGVAAVPPRTINEPSENRAREADPEPIADFQANLTHLYEARNTLREAK